jgi:hypothetical protein
MGPFVPPVIVSSGKYNVDDHKKASEKDRIFVSDLFKNDRNSYFKLVDISELFLQSDIDMKQISAIKSLFGINDSGSVGEVTFADMRQEMNKVLASYLNKDTLVE